MTQENMRLRVNCQKGKTVETALTIHSQGVQKDGIEMKVSERETRGCRLGEIRIEIRRETLSETAGLATEAPVRVYLPMPRPEKITAMYLFNPWWTRPAFVSGFEEIPERTQIAYLKYADRCTCFVPMVGKQFKAALSAGTPDELCLSMTACAGGQTQIDEPLYLSADGVTVQEAVHKAFACLVDIKGIRPREARRIPEMFRYLGWCSWDAFRTEITEDKLREKADELTAKHVPVKWMLFDDGWFDAREKMLYDFIPDKEKFPNGFKSMIEDIREKGDIRWFGIWHALGGYWDGISPDSPLVQSESEYLYRTVNGHIVPSPKTGSGFYGDWYRVLRREGIDFVKVDGQSAAPIYFRSSMPVSEAARGMNEALESGAARMDGAIINCMGMAMENILARPTSAISRNSDDFVPEKENGFAEHLLQNAYNAIYHDEVYCCDWDMFWTKHEDAVKHSLLRAISGGPVYFSDRIGDTQPDVIKPLVYADGRVLMMERSAKPTEDCVFSDPMKDGVLKLHNVASWGGRKGGGIAAYNLTDKRQTVTFTPKDIPDLDVSDRYWVYDYFGKRVNELGRNEIYTDVLDRDGFAWFVILPKVTKIACFGLLDKYAGFTAVESIREGEKTQVIVLRQSGTLGWASDEPPRQVTLGALDVTRHVKRTGKWYALSRPECTGQTVLSVIL